ncbi:MAG: CHASE3 domain-containing protein, partial [Gammaproteobacteria bacterium]|nr:CHASE3 domain-containing protein [Gammaproteobacteria bacterium]
MTGTAPNPASGNWLENLSLDRKIVLAFALVLALFGLSTAVFYQNQTRVNEARDRTTHSYELIEAISALDVTVLVQVAALRGYLLTLEEQYLDPYQVAQTEFDVTWERLQRLTADNPAQVPRLTRVRELMEQWRRETAEPYMAHAAEGRLARAGPAQYRGSLDNPILDLRAEIQTFKDQELLVLEQREADVTADARAARLVGLLSLASALALAALIVLITSRLVTRPIQQLAFLMGRLARGETIAEIPALRRGDEVGVMARALDVLRDSKDKADRAAWIKAGIAQLSASFQTAGSRQELATLLINGVCELLQAGYGAVFLLDDAGETLEFLSGYGYTHRGSVPTRFRRGEGLVGQCAQSGRRIEVAQVPPDYVRVGSGLGDSAPRALCLTPVFGTRGVMGVIELAGFTSFDSRQFEFLDEVLQVAGLALESVSRNDRTQELLRETQVQAEELQSSEQALRAQQEELRATNEALEVKNRQLEEQRRKLAESEQELQVKAEELTVTNEEMEEKSRALDAYNQRLQAAQQALEQKAQELERASRYKSEFLANMSHELRTPLNSLLILARALADNEEGNLSADQVESARVIHDSGKNLLLLINDILDLSKVEAGRMDLVMEDVPLVSVVAILERTFRHVARERGLDYSIHVDPDAPAGLRTDGARLGQILNNLLSNAFKFTDRGGVEVTIGRPAADWTMPAGLEAGAALMFRVADTGVGIAADDLGRLFGAFEQGA